MELNQLNSADVTCKFCKDDMEPVTLALKVSEHYSTSKLSTLYHIRLSIASPHMTSFNQQTVPDPCAPFAFAAVTGRDNLGTWLYPAIISSSRGFWLPIRKLFLVVISPTIPESQLQKKVNSHLLVLCHNARQGNRFSMIFIRKL